MILKIKEEKLKLIGVDSGISSIIHPKGKSFLGIVLFYEDWLSLEEEYYFHNNEVKLGTHNLFDEDGN